MKTTLANLSVSIAILLWAGICFVQFITFENRIPPYLYAYITLVKTVPEIVFQLPDSFILNFFCEIASLLIHGLIGVLFLRLFLRLPLVAEVFASVFIGIGLATFILEIFAIFFLLHPITILLSFFFSIGFLLYLKKRWGWIPAEETKIKEPAQSLIHKFLYWFSWGILTFVTTLSFYHALLYPVDYWDALILYTHYGKITYQQGGFPILVCLQVGLGLGANYPHLFPLHQAVTATLFGHWSDLYGQLIPPLAGLGSIVIIYSLVKRLFNNSLIAVLAALSFRCVAYVDTYFVWVSDYSLVMFYTSMLLMFVALFFECPSIRAFQPLIVVAAIFPHINYLGWIVWPCVILALLWELFVSRDFRSHWFRTGLTVLFWFGLGLTWYIRNWLVTGNPVYAFFPEIFGGINIDLEVLKSCNEEWTEHGFGAAQLGQTLGEKVLKSYSIFLTYWHFAPISMGLFFPAFFLGWKRDQKLFFIGGLLLFLLFIYQYVISGLYWYHTIAVFPILGVFAGRFLSQIEDKIVFNLFAGLLILMAFIPGVAFSIIGPKVANPSLPLFAHPGISADNYYRFTDYASVSKAWYFINNNVEPNGVVLTHDNRYHVYRDDIRIVHLDDCGLIPYYDRPYPEVHKRLWEMGIRYYLHIPDENTHPITRRLGHLFYMDDPNYYEEIFRSEETRLFKLKSGEQKIPSPTN